MFLSTNTTASFVTLKGEVSTSLYEALQFFNPGLALQDSFTFDTIYGTFLVACEGHEPEIYVDIYRETKVNTDVLQVISHMFFVLYGKYKGYNYEELTKNLDSKFKILRVAGEYTLLNFQSNKVYFSNDGDEETLHFITEVDLSLIDPVTIEYKQPFSSWAESLVFPSSSPKNEEDGLGNLWEGLSF